MALIFVFVSVIVCYSAISRMINEQRARIGMQKALGFSTKEIMRHYLWIMWCIRRMDSVSTFGADIKSYDI